MTKKQLQFYTIKALLKATTLVIELASHTRENSKLLHTQLIEAKQQTTIALSKINKILKELRKEEK